MDHTTAGSQCTLVIVICIAFFRRPWIREFLLTASWSALTHWILWLPVWCGTASRTYSCSSSENTTCNWSQCWTMWNKRMSWACLSTWWSLPSPWCHIHVCATNPLPCSLLTLSLCRCRGHTERWTCHSCLCQNQFMGPQNVREYNLYPLSLQHTVLHPIVAILLTYKYKKYGFRETSSGMTFQVSLKSGKSVMDTEAQLDRWTQSSYYKFHFCVLCNEFQNKQGHWKFKQLLWCTKDFFHTSKRDVVESWLPYAFLVGCLSTGTILPLLLNAPIEVR